MDPARDLKDWPLCQHARQIYVKPHKWHVLQLGAGPVALLLHGAGGSTHSWAGLAPLLAQTHQVIAVDLPGQGFTRAGTKTRLSLPKLAEDLHALLRDQSWQPELIIGHSAGGALALQLSTLLDHDTSVVGINAALEPFEGIAGWLFPVMAKMLALNPFTSVALTMGGSAMGRARGLIKTTGSDIPEDSLRCYAQLFSDRGHVDSTLQMMAQWNLTQLKTLLAASTTPALLLAGGNDLTVPPAVSERAAKTMQAAQYANLPNIGHLAHEEAPHLIMQAIADWHPREAARQG